MVKDRNRPVPVLRLSNFVRQRNNYFGLPAWQPRDLRRTFTTLATGFNFDDKILNKAQARKDHSVIRGVYDQRHYFKQLRKLSKTVETEILRITEHDIETFEIHSSWNQ